MTTTKDGAPVSDLSTNVDNWAAIQAAHWHHLLAAHPAPHPYRIAELGLSGSHSYGFASADSDYDLCGIHLIPLDRLLGLSPGQETVERTFEYQGTMQIDLVTHDLGKVCRLLLKHNGSLLEQVCGELPVIQASWHEELVRLARRTVTVSIQRHYRGFAEQQWKFCQKKATVKAFLHLYRTLYTAIRLLETGEVEVSLPRLNADFRQAAVADLIARKSEGVGEAMLDQVDVAIHEAAYRRLLAVLQDKADASSLPLYIEERVKAELSAFLIGVRKGGYKEK